MRLLTIIVVAAMSTSPQQPGMANEAVPPVASGPASAANGPVVLDVQLQTDGSLQGFAITAEGVPAGNVAVTISQRSRDFAKTTTDALGRFSVRGLQGGVYEARAGRASQLYRVWPIESAPPSAKPLAVLVITPETIIRGQSPMSNPKAAAMVGLIGGAIAVPAVYQAISSSNKTPMSP